MRTQNWRRKTTGNGKNETTRTEGIVSCVAQLKRLLAPIDSSPLLLHISSTPRFSQNFWQANNIASKSSSITFQIILFIYLTVRVHQSVAYAGHSMLLKTTLRRSFGGYMHQFLGNSEYAVTYAFSKKLFQGALRVYKPFFVI
ncbi:MAG: hypothetical protein IKE43_11320 [Coriobacteriales bacterium]|nr:hypothetical protein [Coriobacteriales bacterium]